MPMRQKVSLPLDEEQASPAARQQRHAHTPHPPGGNTQIPRPTLLPPAFRGNRLRIQASLVSR